MYVNFVNYCTLCTCKYKPYKIVILTIYKSSPNFKNSIHAGSAGNIKVSIILMINKKIVYIFNN